MDIYDGKNVLSPLIVGGLCGSNSPASIISEENELFIRINSYSNTKKAGVKLKLEERGKIFQDAIENTLSMCYQRSSLLY